MIRPVVLLAAAGVLLAAGSARGAEETPDELRGVTITERLDSAIDQGLVFTDHDGNRVPLSRYFEDGLPVLLTLNYYQCPMLCSLHLNGLTRAMAGLPWAPGNHFRVVTVSINHRETAQLAAAKRRSYLASLGRGDAVDWSFLVGDEASIAALAEQVGFGYRYDAESGQYAHNPALIFLSPGGRVARYLYGIEYRAMDVKFALLEAADGRVGSTVDRILLSCFHFDDRTGRYTPFAFGIMRAGATVAALLLAAGLALLWWRERPRPEPETPS